MKRTRRPHYDPLCKGAVPFDVVQAHRFELVDQDGRIRGGLGFTDDGDPALLLCEYRDGRRVIRVELRLADEGPRFRLFNAEGEARAMLALADDEVGLTFTDAQGQSLLLGLNEKGVTLRLADGRGQYVRLGLEEAGVVAEGEGAEEWLRRLVTEGLNPETK